MSLSAFASAALLLGLQTVLAVAVQQTGPETDVRQAPTGTPVFRVRVLDGRNGLPLENAHVRFWYDDAGSAGFVMATPSNGTAPMPEPVGLPVRVLVAPIDRIDCRKLPLNEPAPGYNLQQIAEKGMVLPNTCGRVSAKPRPGELVLFARPLRWYENINRP